MVGPAQTLYTQWHDKRAFPPAIGLVVDLSLESGFPCWKILTRIDGKVVVKTDFETFANDMDSSLSRILYSSQEGEALPIGTLSLRYGDAKDNASALDSTVFPLKCSLEVPDYVESYSRRKPRQLARLGDYVSGDHLDFRTGKMLIRSEKPIVLKKKNLSGVENEPPPKRPKHNSIEAMRIQELETKLAEKDKLIEQYEIECASLKEQFKENATRSRELEENYTKLQENWAIERNKMSDEALALQAGYLSRHACDAAQIMDLEAKCIQLETDVAKLNSEMSSSSETMIREKCAIALRIADLEANCGAHTDTISKLTMDLAEAKQKNDAFQEFKAKSDKTIAELQEQLKLAQKSDFMDDVSEQEIAEKSIMFELIEAKTLSSCKRMF